MAPFNSSNGVAPDGLVLDPVRSRSLRRGPCLAHVWKRVVTGSWVDRV
ncbi:MAG: hypothetical protein ACO4CG_08840 [Prochlorothrix sp.]